MRFLDWYKYRNTPLKLPWATISSPTAQWARFSKNLQKLIIPNPVHILSIPIQGKGKIA
jgi:hypothetical protein